MFILYSVCVLEMEILIYLSDLCLCNVSYKGNLTSSVLATCLSVVQYLSTNLVTICGFEVGTHNTFSVFPYSCFQHRFVFLKQESSGVVLLTEFSTCLVVGTLLIV